jgi:ABC-type cobalamin/Fe3+-siderophores transport system ATPase subunit
MLLDEPTASLDLAHQVRVRDLMVKTKGAKSHHREHGLP